MRKRSNTVTIREVAKSLNVSVSTVSRALRNTYDVNEETRKRVLEKVEELNYKPNYSAIGLAQGKTHNIGIILPLVTNYYFSTVITGIQEVAYTKDYNIILHLTGDSPERELQILQNLPLGSFDGLLVSTSFRSDATGYYQKIISSGFPVVFFDRPVTNMHTSNVLQDDYRGAYEATRHLIDSRYTKIAHITGPPGLSIVEKRLQGYREALRKHKLPGHQEWIIHSGFAQDHGEEDALRLLQLADRPDAIFAVNDRKAIGAMVALKSRHIAIGREIGVVGFTDDPACKLISPALTTVSEPALEIGKKSCELLLKHLSRRLFTPEKIVLPTRLMVRESTRR